MTPCMSWPACPLGARLFLSWWSQDREWELFLVLAAPLGACWLVGGPTVWWSGPQGQWALCGGCPGHR